MAEVAPLVFIDAIKRERQSRLAEDNLYEFLKQAWAIVEPGVPFTPGWHLETICDHLEAVATGDIRKLLVNIPPRHSKSTIISVIYPVWNWLHNPSERFLTASYSAGLSTRDAAKSRHLITSPWFQERWGDRFNLSGDTNAKQRYQNDKLGYRISTSVGGTATGEGGSTLILDDPHGAQDAQSDTMRETTLEWFDMVWSTRLNDPRKDSMITIMQRLHEQDVSGHILADLGDWEHICLPAEWDGKKRFTSLGQYDPRTVKGSLLWPERFTEQVLTNLKQSLGEYGSAGQLQQDPAPSGGGILKIDHFKKWPADRPIPVLDYVISSWDTAFTEKTTGDPTGCEVWGMFTLDGERQAILLDCWDEHLSYPALRKRAIDDYGSVYGASQDTVPPRRGRKPDRYIIESKASGQSLLQDLWLAKIPIFGYNPGNADKIARAHQASPVLEMGILWIPESKKNPGQFVSWAQPFLRQLEKFPKDAHDEYVDTFSQAIIYLKDNGWFEMQQAEEDELEEFDYSKKKRVNPYAS